MKASKKFCSLAVGLAVLMSPAVLFAQTNPVIEKCMNTVENAGFAVTQSMQDIKNIIVEVPVPTAVAAEKSARYSGPIIPVRSEKTMAYYVYMLRKVTRQLAERPNGAPERYVNGVLDASYRLSRNYDYISRCQEINGEGVEWDDIETALDNVCSSVKQLKYWVKFISASPNYVRWYGNEFTMVLNGIDRSWDEWEYDVNQIGT